MEFEPLAIPDVVLVRMKRFGDARGWFSETFRGDLFAQAGLPEAFEQDNASFSAAIGTVRGLHYQAEPVPQAKLVQVMAGAILDVAVDLRRSSPSFGRHVAVRLDAGTPAALFIPAGFAHGFCTLEANTLVAYKASRRFSAPHDRAVLWNDPAIGIDWPVAEADATLSDKDRRAPTLAAALDLFP